MVADSYSDNKEVVADAALDAHWEELRRHGVCLTLVELLWSVWVFERRRVPTVSVSVFAVLLSRVVEATRVV